MQEVPDIGKKFVTGLRIASVCASAFSPAIAGRLGEPEIEPEVFMVHDKVVAGTRSGRSGGILIGFLIDDLVIAGDSRRESHTYGLTNCTLGQTVPGLIQWREQRGRISAPTQKLFLAINPNP
ncbi:hypothetical protein [Silicimonas sp. MF1-12-2]|uniref:hypothetical protein n=1 Tax=Silicimonas sp. MF1-12-2 TaxID=3384793 RepID=UPI0039B4F387